MLILRLVSTEKVSQSVKEAAGVRTERTEAVAEQASGEIRGKMSEVAGKAEGSMQEMKGEAKGTASEMAGKAKGTASELMGEAKSKKEDVKAKM